MAGTDVCRMTSTLARALVALAVLIPLFAVTTPAQAELVTPQQTSWGLATEGATNNLDRWDALGWATEQVDGMMLVGGKFLDVTNGSQTVNQSWIAAFDAGSGDVLPWWRPDAGGAVLAIENSPDGGAFVGGEMDTWNGQQLGALVKIDPATGDLWPGFNTRVYGGNSVIRDIRLEADGWLYAVGNFTTASDGGVPRAVQGAIRMNPTTGAIDWNWLPQVESGGVWGVSVSPNRNEVYLAGWFRSVAGQANTDGFVGVSGADGSVLRDRSTIPYNTCVGCNANYRLYDVIATEFDQVWVVGEQHALFILDEADLSLDLMHWTGCDLEQQADCNRRGGEFQELERVGNRIYGAGHFWGSHRTDTDIIYSSTPANARTGTPTGRISAVGAYDVVSGQRDQNFNPYMSGDAGGFAVAVASDGCLWMAGGVSQVGEIGNQRQARDLVRLCDEAGPGPDPQPDPAAPSPTSCTAIVNGTEVTIDWAVPSFATDVIVYRAIDDRPTAWRGRIPAPGTQFVEQAVDGSLNTYQVRAKYITGAVSAPLTCQPPIDLSGPVVGDAAPPATCSASNVGRDATVSWAASADATDYRVFRSVDGGTAFWRGVTASTSFDDSLRSSGSHVYSVQARSATGVWSASTICNPPLDPADGGPQPVAAPASCSAAVVAGAGEITWTPSPDATDYRVFRSVNGSRDYWRGVTAATTFNDSLRAGASHVYSVQARGVDGVWSASTICAPPI